MSCLLTSKGRNSRKEMPEKENSVYNNIKRIIKQSEVGRLFNYNDFKECGTYTAIRTAVVDLCKANYLERICQGIYVKPDISNKKNYIPDDITLAFEMDRKNGSVATPRGSTLDYINGILPDMPDKLQFYSTGSGRNIKLPDGRIVSYTLKKN